MGLFDNFDLLDLPPKWQAESDHWVDTYFPEIVEVQDEDRWKRFYPDRPVTKLKVIQATPEVFRTFASRALAATPETADLSWRVTRAEEMDDWRFRTALKIIRAQASTELGSIQQHRMVYTKLDEGGLRGKDKEIVEGIHNVDPDGHHLERLSFSAKRVCVEELRHHYQMAGVLSLDPTWDQRDGGKPGSEVLEELYAMKPGEHVLDAFNIEFQSIMDEATFMALIDRVGKYQLEMQHHFLYAPMALSMPFMRWMEESYHLAAGEKLLQAMAKAAVLDGGNFTLDDLQRTINAWHPRGLEMFGSELSGTHVKGLFKTLANPEAQQMFIDEVEGKVREVNLAAVQAAASCDRRRAAQLLRRIQEKGETHHGLGPDDLLRLPHRRFFRTRGLKEFADHKERDPETGRLGYVYLPYDLDGELMTRNGKPIPREEYADYLKTVLPKRYMDSRHWEFVQDEFLYNPEWYRE